MSFKINKELLPVKAHYFFFMAALGPILPQINVFGRQLGISPDIMGIITSILPILYVLAKPGVGFIADYFSNCRKFIFALVIIIMTLAYTGYVFLPQVHIKNTFDGTIQTTEIFNCDNLNKSYSDVDNFNKATCRFYFNSTESDPQLKEVEINLNSKTKKFCYISDELVFNQSLMLNVSCEYYEKQEGIYSSWTFWAFIFLTYIGTIGFNVGNCISDAICFDVLGEKTMNYGAQRVFGTIGFGVTALIAGILVNNYVEDDLDNFIVPAVIVMLFFSIFDLISIKKLRLPKLSSTESIYKDVKVLLKNKKIALFLFFATVAGILDSFIIYFMFWHLEEVAEKTGYMSDIKLIEGWVVAAECLGGEILFFLISGKILKTIGYVHCLSLCFFNYAVRLALISIIPNPWYLVAVEFFMQGASYALCYTCIVAYAAAIAPAGSSATVQGLVAGMDDGLGFSIGSLIGGQMFHRLGGEKSFKIFALLAIITCVSHIILRPASKHETHDSVKGKYELPKDQIDPKIIVAGNESLENL